MPPPGVIQAANRQASISGPQFSELSLARRVKPTSAPRAWSRSEEHTSELQSRENLVCRLLLECSLDLRDPHSSPTRRSSDLAIGRTLRRQHGGKLAPIEPAMHAAARRDPGGEQAGVDIGPPVFGTVAGAQGEAHIGAARMV